MFFENNPVKIILLNQKIIFKKISPLNSIMTKNNRGFSLVELMVVIGLLGGISLVVMNLTKQSTKSSSKYQFDSEIMLITNEINGILSDPNKCLTTFTNATQAASPASPVLNATPANVTNPTGIAGIPSTLRKYTLAGGPYGNGGVMIASYSLDLAAIPDPLLTINFQKKGILGTGTTPKTIKLHVEKTGPGVITLCRSISTASVDIWSRGAGSDIYYSGGNVGVGTSAPAVLFDLKGDNVQYGGQLRLQSSDLAQISFYDSASSNLSSNNQKASLYYDMTSQTFAINSNQYGVVGGGSIVLNPQPATGANPGNVGIGTSYPSSRLEVVNTSVAPTALFRTTGLANGRSFGVKIEAGTDRYDYPLGIVSQAGAPLFRVTGTGDVGIGMVPAYKLDVLGDINASGNVRAAGIALTSDLQFKRHILPLDNSIEKLKKINGVSFSWAIDEYPEKHFSNRRQIGVIAQDVQAAFPELVSKDQQGYLSVNYPALVAPLIESIKTQQLQIAKRDIEIINLKKENIEIKIRLDKLEKLIKK